MSMGNEISGFNPKTGQAEELGPGLRRVLAPNPSPMTFRGTNSYLLGDEALVVIDPGPDDPAHLKALLAAIGGARLQGILLTHSHLDHSPLARPLARATGAPILAFGDSSAGMGPHMARLAAQGGTGGGEGVDRAFTPDRCLAHGEELQIGPRRLTALHTPGHMGNHMAFLSGDYLFTGDLVMGWASTMVSPPDGDLEQFYQSCALLQGLLRPGLVGHPGHGAPIADLGARIDWLLAHRRERDAQIHAALAQGPAGIEDLTRRVYTDIDPRLLPAAARNVLAHLIAAHGAGRIHADPQLSLTARFSVDKKKD